MGTYILKINEQSKKAKALLQYIKELASKEDDIQLREAAISPTYHKPNNEETQLVLESKKKYQIKNLDDFFDSI